MSRKRLGWLFVTLLPALHPAHAQSSEPARGASGFFHPPGTPSGFRIPYRMTVQRVPADPNKVSFLLTVKNDDKRRTVSFIACAMLRLKGKDVLMDNYSATKDEQLQDKPWKCAKLADQVSRPPSYHFGCTEVKDLAPGTEKTIFTSIAAFSEAIGDARDLSSVYWDVLRYCPLDASCNAVQGANVNLQPESARHIIDTINIWAGQPLPFAECLSDQREDGTLAAPGGHRCSRLFWDAGNWFTMAFPGTYPARLRGTIARGNPGDIVTFVFPDGTTRRYRMPVSGRRAVDVPFVIPDAHEAIVEMEVRTPRPVAPSTNVRFEGKVVADAGNPLYTPGQFMYGVSTRFVADDRPPKIRRLHVAYDASTQTVTAQVAATDDRTWPAAASLRLIGPGFAEVVALDFADPPAIDDVVRFRATHPLAARDAPTAFRVEVADELGNVAVATGTVRTAD